jgi:hypothetical protein
MPIDPSLIPSATRIWDYLYAACDQPDCGWTKKFLFSNGMKLKPGDPLPSGEDPDFDTCMKCKRKSLKVTQVPEYPTVSQRTGFWKVPTE